MKPIKFITTFSQTGYAVYGKTWINSFLSNVNDNNISAEIYVDFPLKVASDKIIIKDFDSAIPNHKKWITQFESEFNGAQYNKKMSVRFSYKAFVMMHALDNNKDCYLIWLDGDCIFKPNQTFSDFIDPLLNKKSIAVQCEHEGHHCESGIVIFDTNHLHTPEFTKRLKNNYEIDNIIQMDSPYDGFVIYKSLKGLEYVDLNNGYGHDKIQSDPNETFLHPEIHKRFLHNIGVTGKSQYHSWDVYSKIDPYFKLINKRGKKTPEEIRNIRKKLFDIRNKL